MKCFEATFEAWSKPWFRKGRMRVDKGCWFAESYEDFLRRFRAHMDSRHKQWKLLNIKEIGPSGEQVGP